MRPLVLALSWSGRSGLCSCFISVGLLVFPTDLLMGPSTASLLFSSMGFTSLSKETVTRCCPCGHREGWLSLFGAVYLPLPSVSQAGVRSWLLEKASSLGSSCEILLLTREEKVASITISLSRHGDSQGSRGCLQKKCLLFYSPPVSNSEQRSWNRFLGKPAIGSIKISLWNFVSIDLDVRVKLYC